MAGERPYACSPAARADNEEHRDQQCVRAEISIEEALKGDSEDRRRYDADQQQPSEAAIAVTLERSIPNRSEECAHERQHVAPEVDKQRDQRAGVKHHVKARAVQELVVPSKHLRNHDQVR